MEREYTPQQRAGLVVWLLMVESREGRSLDVKELAKRCEISVRGMRILLSNLQGASIPLVRTCEGWEIACDER